MDMVTTAMFAGSSMKAWVAAHPNSAREMERRAAHSEEGGRRMPTQTKPKTGAAPKDVLAIADELQARDPDRSRREALSKAHKKLGDKRDTSAAEKVLADQRKHIAAAKAYQAEHGGSLRDALSATAPERLELEAKAKGRANWRAAVERVGEQIEDLDRDHEMDKQKKRIARAKAYQAEHGGSLRDALSATAPR